MPKSKIIKELANGTVDTLIALKRTKVLLTGFDNVELNTWINNEITGYPKDAKIPTYRIVRGSLMGSYFKGSMASHMTWNHVSIPLGKMPEDLQDSLLNVSFREGVEALRQLVEKCDSSSIQLGKQINADFFPVIVHYNKDPYMMIATVYKGNIIKNLIMDCQSYTKYRPNETTGGIFVSWRRKEELPTGA